MTTVPEMVTLDPWETRRTYLYADGSELSFENVVKFGRGNTTHRLELADGTKVIVEPGWRAIRLDVKDWTL